MNAQLPALQLGISAQTHAIAQRMANYYTTPPKRQQAYLNCLAVQVVSDYLQSLALPTLVEQSQALQPHAQLLEDGADLAIPGWGTLVCRPVQAHEQLCYVPPMAFPDAPCTKIMAVRFDAHFRYATLVGFVTTVPEGTTQVPLAAFQDFDDLLDQIITAVAQSPSPKVEEVVNRLGEWLTGAIAAGWQSLDVLLGTPALPLVPMRSRSTAVEQGKIIQLGADVDPVALIVWVEQGLTPEFNVAVELCPVNGAENLPPALELALFDPDSPKALVQAESRGSERLRFKFTGETGDRFEVKVSHQAHSVVEPFVI